MLALRLIATAVLLTFALAAVCLLTRRRNPLDEAETSADDDWLARVAAGALNSHSTDLRREAQRDHVQP